MAPALAPAPVEEHIAPAPAGYAAPVVEYMAPALGLHPESATTVEYIAPAPAGHATPAPVVEYTSPAPVAQHLHQPRCNTRLTTVSVTTLLRIRPLRKRDCA